MHSIHDLHKSSCYAIAELNFDQLLPLTKMAHMAGPGQEASSSSASFVYHAPIGPLKLVANGDGISAVKFLFGKHGATLPATDVAGLGEIGARKAEEVGSDSDNEATYHLEVCKKWLDAYFGGVVLGSHPPPRPKLALEKKSEYVVGRGG